MFKCLCVILASSILASCAAEGAEPEGAAAAAAGATSFATPPAEPAAVPQVAGESPAPPEKPEVAELQLSDVGMPAIEVEQVEIGGLTFDVRTAGPEDGDVVILLHGFPETGFEWRHQLPRLAAAGYRAIAPDLRGTSPGARPAAVEDYGLLSFLGDVLGLADAYGAARFHVVGHDVGALLAWGTGQFFGGRLKSLTAISVPHPFAFATQLADPSSCQSRASSWYAELMEEDAARRLLDGDPPLLLETWGSFAPEAEAEYRRVLGTEEALNATLNVWRANFVDGEPQGAFPLPVFVPTLFVWGDQDPYNCSEGEPMTRALTWSSYRYEVLTGVGHFVPEEAPERFSTLLLEHLRRHRF